METADNIKSMISDNREKKRVAMKITTDMGKSSKQERTLSELDALKISGFFD